MDVAFSASREDKP